MLLWRFFWRVFFFQAEDGIRCADVTGVQTCALPILGEEGIGLWDDQDKFFYDVLHTPDGRMTPLKVRSMVGLIPLFAVETLEPELLDRVPEFKERLEWFLSYRPDLARLVSHWNHEGRGH